MGETNSAGRTEPAVRARWRTSADGCSAGRWSVFPCHSANDGHDIAGGYDRITVRPPGSDIRQSGLQKRHAAEEDTDLLPRPGTGWRHTPPGFAQLARGPRLRLRVDNLAP